MQSKSAENYNSLQRKCVLPFNLFTKLPTILKIACTKQTNFRTETGALDLPNRIRSTLRDEDRSHKTANQPQNHFDRRWPFIRCEEAFFV